MVTDFSEKIAAFVFRTGQMVDDSDDEGSKLLRNFGNHAPTDTARYSGKLGSL
jgi:hypothetical protein